MTMIRNQRFIFVLFVALLSTISLQQVSANIEDQLDEICEELVKQDKCRTDADLMMKYCEKSCVAWQDNLAKIEGERVDPSDGDFFDFSAKTSTGAVLDFERFEGYMTMVMNVALSCSPEHKLEDGLKQIEHIQNIYPYSLEIVVFPFRHPKVDYETADCAENMAALKKGGRKIHVMEEVEVNGDNTHPVFKFLKKPFKIDELSHSIATFFFVRPNGVDLVAYHGASEQHIMKFLSQQLNSNQNEL